MTLIDAPRVLAVDAGSEWSGFVLYDGRRVIEHGYLKNRELLARIKGRTFGGPFVTVLEEMQSYGNTAGRSVLRTVFWSGRFAQASSHFAEIARPRIKVHLLGTVKGGDPDVRRALIARFGGASAIGTSKAKGPLFGVTSHRWSALAVAVTFCDQRRRESVA